MKARELSRVLALATIVATFGLAEAEANSRFKVQNDSETKVLVNIFNGDDSICAAEAKHHTVGAGDEQGMGCTGGGKNRCKARISARDTDDGKWEQICLGINNGCGDNVVILPNHARLVISGSSWDNTSCKIEKAD